MTSNAQPTRRDFLKLLTIIPSCAWISQALSASLHDTAKYYIEHRDELIKAFLDTNNGAKQYLAAAIGEEDATTVTGDAIKRFERLLPDLPNVGGDDNVDTQYLVIAAWYAAYYPSMKACGQSAEGVGRMIYELNKTELAAIPRRQAMQAGDDFFSATHVATMKQWAESSLDKKYPANWVAEFIEGDGKDFDFGYTYTECAVCKYLHAGGMPELAPFVCLNDFLTSKADGTGLHRTTTLGQGGQQCNFRYKRGGSVTQNWDTEIDLIRERIAKGQVCTVPT